MRGHGFEALVVDELRRPARRPRLVLAGPVELPEFDEELGVVEPPREELVVERAVRTGEPLRSGDLWDLIPSDDVDREIRSALDAAMLAEFEAAVLAKIEREMALPAAKLVRISNSVAQEWAPLFTAEALEQMRAEVEALNERDAMRVFVFDRRRVILEARP